MTDAFFAPLPNRGLVSLSGANVTEFLQGLVTNDVTPVGEGRAVYAALLTPQGKYLHDFFIFPWNGAVFIECESRRREDLVRRLARYRLRARIDIVDTGAAFETFAVFGTGAARLPGIAAEEGQLAAVGDGIAFTDPRMAVLGVRASFPAGLGGISLREAGAAPVDKAAYDALRLSHGVAEGDPEIEAEKSYPMDFGLDALHGISFTKGCYVGQEVTARMKSRALVRRRLIPVDIEGSAPPIGTPIGVGSESAGELRAVSGNIGLALVRIDMADRAERGEVCLEADGVRLHPRPAR